MDMVHGGQKMALRYHCMTYACFCLNFCMRVLFLNLNLSYLHSITVELHLLKSHWINIYHLLFVSISSLLISVILESLGKLWEVILSFIFLFSKEWSFFFCCHISSPNITNKWIFRFCHSIYTCCSSVM